MANINITFPKKRGGAWKEVTAFEAGYANDDGISGFIYAGKTYQRTKKGTHTCDEVGIFSDGTDQSARVNIVMADAKVKSLEIGYSGGGTVLITGTVTIPAGKHLYFKSGSSITTSGAGAVNGGIIHTDDHSRIFAGTMNFTPEGFAEGYTSVKSWGAKGLNDQDDQPYIQKAIDLCVNNDDTINRVRMPAGSYRIDTPIFIKKYTGGAYQFCYVQIEGDFRYTSPVAGTIIYANFKDRFALGIQLGKGVKISGIWIRGLFVPPFTEGPTFYNATWASFVDATCRDTPYSPNCGVAIEPVCNAANLPPDGGYPGMTADYKGTNFNEGSTGLEFNDIRIDGFPVDFITSPNGFTSNAELIKINNLQVGNCRTGVVGCQAQEKLNVINNLMSWEVVHTVFMQGFNYGEATSGHWILNGVNIAGSTNRFIYHPNADWFPTYVKDFFSESLGSFGLFNSEVGSSVTRGEMSFQVYGDGITMPMSHIEGVGVTFSELSIRDSLANAVPVIIKGQQNFVNCHFNIMPYAGVANPDAEPKQFGGLSRFMDCYVAGVHLYPSKPVYTTDLNPYPIIGDHILMNNGSERAGIVEVVKVEPYKHTLEVYSDQYVAYTVTNDSFVLPVPANELYKFEVGRPAVVQFQNLFIGMVSEVNAINNTVTIVHVPKDMASFGPTTTRIGCSYPMAFPGRFIGDISNGSNLITNVVMDYGTLASLNGKWIKVHTSGSGGGDNQNFSYEKVTNVSGTTLTISDNMSIDAVGYSFNNWSKKEVRMIDRNITLDAYTKPVLKRDSVILANTAEFKIVKGGFGLSHADSRKLEHIYIDIDGNVGFSQIAYYSDVAIPTLTNDRHFAHKKYVDDLVPYGGGLGWETSATDATINASVEPRLILVTASEGNNDDKSVYLHTGTEIVLIATIPAS